MADQATNEEPTLAPWQVEGKPDRVIVTQENFNDYVNEKLGPVVNPDPEAEAETELAEIEAKKVQTIEQGPKEGDINGSEVFFKGKWVKKHDFNYRVHLKTEEAKAETKAELEKTAAEAKAAREEAAKAAKERDELRAKYEPPQSLDPGAEPNETSFTDMASFKAAYKEWAAKSARAEDARKQQEAKAKSLVEEATKRWQSSEAELIAEIPDYAQRLANAPGGSINVSNELKDAIFDSDNGPRLRLHLAENPDVLNELLSMPVGKMLKQVGRLEAGLTKAAPVVKGTPLAEVQISKAPEPITPVRGGKAVTGLKIDAQGNWTGTPEEFKAARLAGKIK